MSKTKTEYRIEFSEVDNLFKANKKGFFSAYEDSIHLKNNPQAAKAWKNDPIEHKENFLFSGPVTSMYLTKYKGLSHDEAMALINGTDSKRKLVYLTEDYQCPSCNPDDLCQEHFQGKQKNTKKSKTARKKIKARRKQKRKTN